MKHVKFVKFAMTADITICDNCCKTRFKMDVYQTVKKYNKINYSSNRLIIKDIIQDLYIIKPQMVKINPNLESE